MVECEFAYNIGSIAGLTVLIDTWWNVNPARGIKLLNGINRFNRYMVECECYHKRYGYIGIGVLIDTWWNVNVYLQLHFRLFLSF